MRRKTCNRILRILLCTVVAVPAVRPAAAGSFHWVDRQGFHGMERLDKVPLEHRKDLPMARNMVSLPFTANEDRDGAMYAWFMLGRAGLVYPFTKTRDLPKSPFFITVQEPRPADIAWWKGFMALSQGRGKVSSAQGETTLQAMEKKRGKVTWYRFSGSPATPPPAAKTAPPTALKTADRSLAGLDQASTLPPRVKDDAERQRVIKEWEKTTAGLEKLRKSTPTILRCFGDSGCATGWATTLAVPGAWERAEAYLLRTEELLQEAPEAYISLGILYTDSSEDYAILGEKQFRTALLHARQEQLPQIWWGLALALHYQGKTGEALDVVDRLIAQHPNASPAPKTCVTPFFTSASEK